MSSLTTSLFFTSVSFADKGIINNNSYLPQNKNTKLDNPLSPFHTYQLKNFSGFKNKDIQKEIKFSGDKTGGIVLIKTSLSGPSQNLQLICLDGYLFVNYNYKESDYHSLGIGSGFTQFMEFDKTSGIVKPKRCWEE